jgi:hypothetical protein
MLNLIKLFYEIALFKKTPQSIPYSPFLSRITLLAYALISFLMLYISSPWFVAVLQMGADVLLLIAFVKITLAWVGKSMRYQQTLCALLGTDALMTFAAFPAAAVLSVPSGDIMWLGLVVMVGLLLWRWAVIGYILHHATEQPQGLCLGLALLYAMLAYALMDALSPEAITQISSSVTQ